MSQQNKKMQLLGNAPIPQALLAMGIPTMIGKRSIASTCSSTPFSAIIVSHYTESKKLSTQLF